MVLLAIHELHRKAGYCPETPQGLTGIGIAQEFVLTVYSISIIQLGV